ncbi:sugar MFS transporter [Pseudomonas sp. LTJR-52]|uniref:sugar MFS transporter n=1 Tax=Pseudomonas sp. LTJR-52 TaxID=2479392 RepID=UPI000EFC4D3B|nr:sugar MFS transporter [Pseudomonas sp. LTJR-52]AYN97081.1 sugar MFS transporter [Pseudomonas sp. LTJR-52]
MNHQAISNRRALIVITTIFFMWGMINSLNDVLIPHLRAVFSLSYTQAMLVQLTFFGAYFLMSLPGGKLLGYLGYKRTISTGLFIAGSGALLFYPAARLPSYPLFLLALFVLSTGITLLQVSANPYASRLGSEATASSRLNFTQAFNSLGGIVAPALGGLLILSGSVLGVAELAKLSPAQQLAYRVEQAQAVQLPYLGLAGLLFALSVLVYRLKLPDFQDAGDNTQSGGRLGEVLRWPHVRLGVVAMFLYVGAEVAISSFLINYISQSHIGNVSERNAAFYVSFYWGLGMVGRLLGSMLLRYIPPGRLLGLNAIACAALCIVTLFSEGLVAMWSLVSIGFFNAIMFPTIFTLGIATLGPLTGRASSLLVMAIVGAAIVPMAQGIVADLIGLQVSFIMPLFCYLYVIFYGFKGSRVTAASAQVLPVQGISLTTL